MRCVVDLYFAAGVTLLIGYMVGMDSVLRFQANRRFATTFLVGVFVGILGLLALSGWDTFARPVSRRKWIVLCVPSSLGFIALLSAPAFAGGQAAL